MSGTLAGAWIYVMMSTRDRGCFKIGRTRRNPIVRWKELRGGSPGLALERAYFIPDMHGKLSKIEAEVHKQFGGRMAFHDESVSEFFPGEAEWACQWIEAIFDEWWGPVGGAHAIGSDRVACAYESDLELLYNPIAVHPVDGLPM